MKIEIIRQRRKTISLRLLSSANAVVKVPLNCNEKKVKEFLEKKKSWLSKNTERLKKIEAFSCQFDLKNNLYVFGKSLCGVDKREIKNITSFYISKFYLLEEIAQKISLLTGLKFSKLKPTNSKCIWGSFSSEKIMKLNWKLIMLPTHLIEYVVLHELCHGAQMNHSPKFWNIVREFCPNYLKCKQDLKNFSFILKNDF